MNFTENKQKIQANSFVHSINTRNKYHFCRQKANLSCFQKSALFADIIIFKRLPLRNEEACFKVILRIYLNMNSFHTVHRTDSKILVLGYVFGCRRSNKTVF